MLANEKFIWFYCHYDHYISISCCCIYFISSIASITNCFGVHILAARQSIGRQLTRVVLFNNPTQTQQFNGNARVQQSKYLERKSKRHSLRFILLQFERRVITLIGNCFFFLFMEQLRCSDKNNRNVCGNIISSRYILRF